MNTQATNKVMGYKLRIANCELRIGISWLPEVLNVIDLSVPEQSKVVTLRPNTHHVTV